MRARVLGEVPDLNTPVLVTADEFSLVRVDDDVVDGTAVVIVPLNVVCSGASSERRACEQSWFIPSEMAAHSSLTECPKS